MPQIVLAEKGFTLYYKGSLNPVYAHYQINSEAWTALPGLKMDIAEDGYYKIYIPRDSGTLNVAFNNGTGKWDSRYAKNYQFDLSMGAAVYEEYGKILYVKPILVTPVPATAPTPTDQPTPIVEPTQEPTPTATTVATALPTTTPVQTTSPTKVPIKCYTVIVKQVITPVPTATPKPTIKVTPKPTIKVTPKVTPRVTAKITPKITAKPTVKVTPKATIKPTATPTPKPTPRIVWVVKQVCRPTGTPVTTPATTPVPTATPAPAVSVIPSASPTPVVVVKDTFSWDNATIYFVITDRFENGDLSNDNSYGRVKVDSFGKNIGTFHGGDIKGLTKKLEDGYFTDLGVTAIWMTAPYEQVHGWVGGGSSGDFAHYPYHGYYALDYTAMDKNMGTVEDMRKFVNTAHSKGIRVMLDVVMNHPGYATVRDMEDYNFASRNGLGSTWTPSGGQTWHSYHSQINYNDSAAWSRWWGNWVRAGISGYQSCGNDERTQCLAGLPDFKTEVTSDLGLPPLLQTKWSKESSGFEAWNIPSAIKYRSPGLGAPADYISKWLSAWVEEFGIDGFRVDTAKHVDLYRWNQLKIDADQALTKWRANNPRDPASKWDEKFWMVAEVWGHGVNKSDYFQNGFDAVINFGFQSVNVDNLEDTFSNYASVLNSDDSFNVLNYISSHDTSLYDRSKLIKAGTALLLAPGAAQIFYGDETGRPFGDTGSDKDQGTRSSMNWSNINQSVLSHWQKIGSFRAKHISIGAGQHKKLSDSPYVFSRTYNKNGVIDNTVVAINAFGFVSLSVDGVFSNGQIVRDAYSGKTTTIINGKANIQASESGVVLLELQ